MARAVKGDEEQGRLLLRTPGERYERDEAAIASELRA